MRSDDTGGTGPNDDESRAGSVPDDSPLPAGRLDPRAIDDSRLSADSVFEPTRREDFWNLFEDNRFDELWNALAEIYAECLTVHYRRWAGRSARFPKLQSEDPESVVADYFLKRVTRRDFKHGGSWYGKWLEWRQSNSTKPARHLRHWIKTDFRNFVREESKREKSETEQPLSPLMISNLAATTSTSEDREDVLRELAKVAKRARTLVAEGYPDERRLICPRLFELVDVQGKKPAEVAQELGVDEVLARQWRHRFKNDVRKQAQSLLGALGYEDSDINQILGGLS